MKKFLQKRKILPLCAILFALCCMGACATVKPSDSENVTAETEMMTEGAIPLAGAVAGEMSSEEEATPSNARKVKLDAGEGSLSTAEVTLGDDDKLPNLPSPTREGWTFDGWYTAEVKEIYLNGGDEMGDGVPYIEQNDKGAILKELKEQLEGTTLAEKSLKDTEVIEKHHSWLIDTAGEKMTAGKTVPKDVSTLYAKYTPKTVVIKWHNNGWEGSTGVLESHGGYDSYAYTWDYSDRTWGGRVFEGWSLEPKGETVLKNGYVYRIGGGYLKCSGGDTIDLYAVWSGDRDVTEVKVEILNEGNRKSMHTPSEWRYFLQYTQLPAEAVKEQVTWSIEPEGVGYFVPQTTPNIIVAGISVSAAKDRKLTSVTVKATTESGVVGSIELPLNHSWNRNYVYQPTCEHTGYVVYECSVCGTKNQPTLPKTDHTFSHTHIPATCTEPGYQKSVCKVCGYEETVQDQAALGHNWGAGETVEVCGGTGHIWTCLTCGAVKSDVDVTNADHQWSSTPVVDQEPTCSQPGSQSYHCLKCGLSRDSEIIPPDPERHNWSNWYVAEKAKVGVMGMQRRTCGNCRMVETQDIPALVPGPEDLAEQEKVLTPDAGPADDVDADSDNSSDDTDNSEVPGVVPETGSDDSDTEDDGNVPETENASDSVSDTETAGDPGSSSDSEGGSGSSSGSGSNSSGSSGSGSSSGGGGGSRSSSGGGGGSRSSSGGGGGGSRSSSGGGGGSRSSSGSGSSSGGSSVSSAAGTGQTAAAETATLPIIPTEEIREALPEYVEVGNWAQADDGSWTFKDEDGETYTNRWAAVYNPYAQTDAADAFDWFRFDETGHLITGWYEDPTDGNTYYMNPASDGTQGRMMTGWVVIDGKEYYFNPSSDGARGRMFRNEMTPDGHFVGPDGAKIS